LRRATRNSAVLGPTGDPKSPRRPGGVHGMAGRFLRGPSTRPNNRKRHQPAVNFVIPGLWSVTVGDTKGCIISGLSSYTTHRRGRPRGRGFRQARDLHTNILRHIIGRRGRRRRRRRATSRFNQRKTSSFTSLGG